MKEIIAKNISDMVKLSKIKVIDIAEKIGIDKSMLYDYMKGEHMPNLITFRKLCKILDCSYEDILG